MLKWAGKNGKLDPKKAKAAEKVVKKHAAEVKKEEKAAAPGFEFENVG